MDLYDYPLILICHLSLQDFRLDVYLSASDLCTVARITPATHDPADPLEHPEDLALTCLTSNCESYQIVRSAEEASMIVSTTDNIWLKHRLIIECHNLGWLKFPPLA